MVAGVSQIHIPVLSCKQRSAAGADAGSHRTLLLGSENRVAESMITRLVRDHELGRDQQLEGSPFVFCGVSGTGKSLIAECLVHYWSRRSVADLPALITNGSDWAHHVDAAGNQTSRTAWSTTGERISLFVIEDIEQLANHRRAQYELGLLLDDLRSRAVPVIGTCKQLPMDLQQFDARLVSRLQGGTLIQVQLPSEETKRAFADRLDLNIDVRAALNCRLGAVESLQQVRALANELLVHGERLDKRIEPEAVIRLCARHFGIGLRDLRGDSRRRAVSHARQVTIFVLRESLELPLKRIGKLLGSRDHSTVLHAYRKVSAQLREDSDLFATVQNIRLEMQRLQGTD